MTDLLARDIDISGIRVPRCKHGVIPKCFTCARIPPIDQRVRFDKTHTEKSRRKFA